MRKVQERQIILKTDHRTVLLDGGNSKQNQPVGTRTEFSSKAMFLKFQYAMAAAF